MLFIPRSLDSALEKSVITPEEEFLCVSMQASYSEAYTALLDYSKEIYPHFHSRGRRLTLEDSLLTFHNLCDVRSACNLFVIDQDRSIAALLALVNPYFDSTKKNHVVNLVLLRMYVDAVRLPPEERIYVRENIAKLVRKPDLIGIVLAKE